MSSRDLATGLVTLCQIVVGVLGNFSLLYRHIFLYVTGFRLRSTDLILNNLIVANSLSILTSGVPRTMAAFGLKDFLNDTGCKLLYFRSIGRDVSIGSTCLLSIFQAITIIPRNSRWAEIKVKIPNYITLSISLCWLLYMLVNIIFPVFVTGNWRNDTIIKRKDFRYCSAKYHDRSADSLYAALLSFPDALCLGLMLWASGSTVSILYRHKQRVQHIHRTSLSPRSSPESRATQTILLLVSTFVSFYTLSCIIQVCVSLFDSPSLLLQQIGAIFTLCFPTVSPFVLMGCDSSVSGVSFSCRRKKNSPNSIRYM
ncbi:vomeronasal type-1 receptor 4-like [Choloepus didactylus]|uniref:vomeronasal type-1 receptor 4-like n=1 Tax=Choloepus didactylus TaxID=27675 RepID=UPI0018A0909E|nr:vomeronasal type-1 receptor 4-like [Choloepus didactylus]